MLLSRRTGRALAVVLGVALLAPTGAAQPKRKPSAAAATSASASVSANARCFDGYESSQRLRRDSKLRDAREQLIVCSSDGCPAALRVDCGRWLQEVDTGIPTVVLAVRGLQNEDVTSVRVALDGKPLVDKLDGKAIAVDPGEHDFHFELADGTTRDQHAVLVEGQKLRRIEIDFAPPVTSASVVAPPPSAPVAAPPPPPPVVAPPPPVAPGPSRPYGAYALFGVSVVALGSFAFFGAHGLAQKSDLDGCSPLCSSSRVSTVRTSFIVADVSLVVALVAAGLGTYGVLRPQRDPATGLITAPLAF